MKRLRSLLILVAFALMPLLAFATNEGGEKSEGLDIPKVVLEHLSDSYEWHIATYEGKHLSIPLPIIVGGIPLRRELVRRYGGKSA